jgi:hypothetical protein
LSSTPNFSIIYIDRLFHWVFFGSSYKEIDSLADEIQRKVNFASLKRQNPFIQLLTEGKKLRDNNVSSSSKNPLQNGEEISEEEYLEKLKEIRMMNAKDRKQLYEKYGRARSSLEMIEMRRCKNKSKLDFDNLLTSSSKIDPDNRKSGSSCAMWIDFSEILNQRSGRRTVNSDTYIIKDFEHQNDVIKNSDDVTVSDADDDNDVTMIPVNNSSDFSSPSNTFIIGENESKTSKLLRRRSSGMLETIRNLICLGQQ